MKAARFCYVQFLFTLVPFFCFSQKGMPPKEIVTVTVSTNFPQHEDFKEDMLSRLTLPSGFKAEVAAGGLGKPRMMAFADNGSLYITRRDQGDVLLLNDADGDGKFEDMKTVATKFPGVHGIAIRNGYIYLCANKEIKKAKIKPDGTLEKADTLVKNMPDGGQHPNRTIAFGPDGLLYITVGSDCNDCSESNAEHATVLQATADGKRRIYARGLRNTIGIDWHPITKEMWGADNGGDYKGDDFPPEELNKIIDGGDYGWPLVYADKQPDATREDPPGTTKEAYAITTQSPALMLPAHTAPIDFKFLSKTTFPLDYKNDALLCLHGSWNKLKADGYKVVRIRFDNGKPVSYEDFLSGFLSKEGTSRFGRPAGIAISPKGDVYISDDENGNIYKVSVQ